MEPVKPLSVLANRNTRELTIAWNDGHTSVYPFGLVRAACPCASCRGGHENMSPEPDPMVFDIVLPDTPAIHLNKIETVGGYAISFEWEDGHHFGIYTWNYLRKLCPCPSCRAL